MLSSLLLSAYNINLSSRLWFSLGATYLSFFWATYLPFFWIGGGNKNTAGDDFSYPNLGTWIKKKFIFYMCRYFTYLTHVHMFLHKFVWKSVHHCTWFWELISPTVHFFDSKMAVMIKAEREVQETFVLEVWKPVCIVRWMAKSCDVILERWWK